MNAVKVDKSGLRPGGPLVAYTDALSQAATQTGESVQVTKDVMKIKALFRDRAFLDDLQFVVNDPSKPVLKKASEMVELMQPLESTVMPKFVTFLAKKRRLQALKPMAVEYMSSIYKVQNIVPVLVKSAQPLTEEQQEAIKEKMKQRTGASDIKLVCSVDNNLIAGMQLTYGFVDPENLEVPTEGLDLSLKTFLEDAALNEGIVTMAE